MNTYSIGDIVLVTATFTDVSGNLIDPSAVTCAYKITNSSASTAAVTHVSTGIYTAQISIAIDGLYTYRFAGTGAAQAAKEGVFTVIPSVVLGI